jgi:hypothetical protein
MKAKLLFDLDEPFDKVAHMRCMKALDMALALFVMSNGLRGALKYGQHPAEVCAVLERVQLEFYKILEEYDLSIDELVQ